MGRIKYQYVAVEPRPSIPDQVGSIGEREERLAGSEWRFVIAGNLCLRRKIERVTHILKPPEIIGRHGFRRLDRRLRSITVHRIHREMVPAREEREHGFNPSDILRERLPTDFDLDMCVSLIKELPDFISQS